MVEETQRKQERVQIGSNFDETPQWRCLAGVLLIDVSILVRIVPMILCAILVGTHPNDGGSL
jgi:hypothetical protein